MESRIRQLRYSCEQFRDIIADLWDDIPELDRTKVDHKLKAIEEIVDRVSLETEV